MSRSKSATGRLEAATAAVEEATRKLAELNVRRNEHLLRDSNVEAIRLQVQIDALNQEVRAHRDKIELLKAEVEREANEKRIREREGQIKRIEFKIAERDKAMEEVASAIKQLAVASERAITVSREIVAAWVWAPHDLPAALLTPPSILTAISHESFRCSYHPRRYGGMDTDPLAGHMLPGSRCPRLEWTEQPERTRPMIHVVHDASEFAKRFLRMGKGSAVVEVVQPQVSKTDDSVSVTNGGNTPQRPEAEARLASLLKKQAELAEDMSPQGEQEYARVVSEIAKAQAEVTAQQQVGAQRHGG
jgi:hypothetical protein